ncbi:helix-turn-helix domain-containing protein [Streptomyces sp. NBC_00620]|nr:helix-turn-helix domain-containing protein [Streptomyces sp. NBC_00620]
MVTWRRAQMVLLSAQGMPVAKIAEVSFTSDDRVRDVIHNFNTDGFDSLYPKYKGGRPRTFTLPERREIKKIAKSKPTEHDLPRAFVKQLTRLSRLGHRPLGYTTWEQSCAAVRCRALTWPGPRWKRRGRTAASVRRRRSRARRRPRYGTAGGSRWARSALGVLVNERAWELPAAGGTVLDRVAGHRGRRRPTTSPPAPFTRRPGI